jgi:hypothetical protein
MSWLADTWRALRFPESFAFRRINDTDNLIREEEVRSRALDVRRNVAGDVLEVIPDVLTSRDIEDAERA